MASRRDDEAAAVRAVLDDLRRRSAEWDWLAWGAVRAESPAAAVLAAVPGVEWLPHQTEYVLPLAATWAEQRAGLSRNIKESLRKCYNAPKRDNIKLDLEVARTPEAIRAALPRLFELHAARANLEGTVKHPNVFGSPRARTFVASAASAMAARGAACVFQLVHRGEVVATRLAFPRGDRLYLYYSGYDPAFAKYSVMTTTVCEMIQWAIRERMRTVDFSFGADVSKTRWGPTEVEWRSAIVPSTSWRGRAARILYSKAMKLVQHDMMRAWAGRQKAWRRGHDDAR